MRIEQLEYLTAVVEHGSLRRAGESLHVCDDLNAVSTAAGQHSGWAKGTDRRQ